MIILQILCLLTLSPCLCSKSARAGKHSQKEKELKVVILGSRENVSSGGAISISFTSSKSTIEAPPFTTLLLFEDDDSETTESSDSNYSGAHNNSLVSMAPYIDFEQFDSGLLFDVFEMIAHHADRPIRTMFTLRRVCKLFQSILDVVMARVALETPVLAIKLRTLPTYRLLRKRRFDSWSHLEKQQFQKSRAEKDFGAILKRFCRLHDEEGLVFNSSVPLPSLIIKSELIQLIIFKAAMTVSTWTMYCICVDQVAREFQNPNVYWAIVIYLVVCWVIIFDVWKR